MVEVASDDVAVAGVPAVAEVDPGAEAAVRVDRVGVHVVVRAVDGDDVLLAVGGQGRGDRHVAHAVPAAGADRGDRAQVGAALAGVEVECAVPAGDGDDIADAVAVQVGAGDLGDAVPAVAEPAALGLGKVGAGVDPQLAGAGVDGDRVVDAVSGLVAGGRELGELEVVAAEALGAAVAGGQDHAAVAVAVRDDAEVVGRRPARTEERTGARVEGVVGTADCERRAHRCDHGVGGTGGVVAGLRVEAAGGAVADRPADPRGDHGLLDGCAERARHRRQAFALVVARFDGPVVAGVPREQAVGDLPGAARLPPGVGDQLGVADRGGAVHLEPEVDAGARVVVGIVAGGVQLGGKDSDLGVAEGQGGVDLRGDVLGGGPDAVLVVDAVAVVEGARAVDGAVPADLVLVSGGQRRDGHGDGGGLPGLDQAGDADQGAGADDLVPVRVVDAGADLHAVGVPPVGGFVAQGDLRAARLDRGRRDVIGDAGVRGGPVGGSDRQVRRVGAGDGGVEALVGVDGGFVGGDREAVVGLAVGPAVDELGTRGRLVLAEVDGLPLDAAAQVAVGELLGADELSQARAREGPHAGRGPAVGDLVHVDRVPGAAVGVGVGDVEVDGFDELVGQVAGDTGEGDEAAPDVLAVVAADVQFAVGGVVVGVAADDVRRGVARDAGGGRIDPDGEGTLGVVEPGGVEVHAQGRGAVGSGERVGDARAGAALAGAGVAGRVDHGAGRDGGPDSALLVLEHDGAVAVEGCGEPAQAQREGPGGGRGRVVQDEGLLHPVRDGVVDQVGLRCGQRVGDGVACGAAAHRRRAGEAEGELVPVVEGVGEQRGAVGLRGEADLSAVAGLAPAVVAAEGHGGVDGQPGAVAGLVVDGAAVDPGGLGAVVVAVLGGVDGAGGGFLDAGVAVAPGAGESVLGLQFGACRPPGGCGGGAVRFGGAAFQPVGRGGGLHRLRGAGVEGRAGGGGAGALRLWQFTASGGVVVALACAALGGR